MLNLIGSWRWSYDTHSQGWTLPFFQNHSFPKCRNSTIISRESGALFCPPQAITLTCTYIHTHRHAYIIHITRNEVCLRRSDWAQLSNYSLLDENKDDNKRVKDIASLRNVAHLLTQERRLSSGMTDSLSSSLFLLSTLAGDETEDRFSAC